MCYYKDKSAATQEWQALSRCMDLARLEQDFGEGSWCTHWDEFCFRYKVMSTNPAAHNVMPISRITVGSWEDLGYTVNYGATDSFNGLDHWCMCHGGARQLRSIQPKVQCQLSQAGENVDLSLLAQAAELEKGEGTHHQPMSVVVLVKENGELYSRHVEQRLWEISSLLQYDAHTLFAFFICRCSISNEYLNICQVWILTK